MTVLTGVESKPDGALAERFKIVGVDANGCARERGFGGGLRFGGV